LQNQLMHLTARGLAFWVVMCLFKKPYKIHLSHGGK